MDKNGDNTSSRILSPKHRKRIEQTINHLKLYSLIDKTESVIEGCYPIRIKKINYYCLLTENKLVFSAKIKNNGPKKLLLFPFQQIEENTLEIYRHPIAFTFLILDYILVTFTSIIFAIGSLVPLGIILFATIMPILVFITPSAISGFFQGEEIIQLRIPGKKINLHRVSKYLYYGRGDLIFFENLESLSEFKDKKGNLKDLFVLLEGYIKSSVY